MPKGLAEGAHTESQKISLPPPLLCLLWCSLPKCRRATQPQVTRSQLNKARRVLCISKVHEEFKAKRATCVSLKSTLDVFGHGWVQELQPRSGNRAYRHLLALFSCFGFILGLHVVALSKYRLPSSMLLSCSQETASLFTGPSVHSHGPPEPSSIPEPIMAPRAMGCTVSPCPGHLPCLGLVERSEPQPRTRVERVAIAYPP